MMVKVTKKATIITKRNNKMRCFDDDSANCVERYLADSEFSSFPNRRTGNRQQPCVNSVDANSVGETDRPV